MSINPSDQQELTRLFSGQSAGHCLTCGSEKVQRMCGLCDGVGTLVTRLGKGGRPVDPHTITCPTCQGRGVRTVCAVCQQVTP